MARFDWRSVTNLKGFATLALGMGLLGCGFEIETPAESRAPLILARLNGEELTDTQFSEYLRLAQGELSEDPNPEPRGELFREFLISRLLIQEARRKGVTVGEEELRSYIDDWVARDSETREEFPDALYEYLLARKLVRQEALSGIEVTLRDLQKYYEEHSTDFDVGDQARVLEILVGSQEEAVQLRGRLLDGDVNRFKEMARLYSLGVTAKGGGDLGLFQKGELPEEFEKVIFQLAPGEVSEPFQSSHGYHLFTLEEWIPAHPQRFYEVRDWIFAELTTRRERQAVAGYIDGLLRVAALVIVDPDLAMMGREMETNGFVD